MDIYILDLMGSNRTFMELKLGYENAGKLVGSRSNRTFMELKFKKFSYF